MSPGSVGLDLYPLAVTLSGILGMLTLWYAVQRLWARCFGVDGDVLALRKGCGGCAHAGHCTAAELCPDLFRTTTPSSVGPARGGPRPTPRQKAG